MERAFLHGMSHELSREHRRALRVGTVSSLLLMGACCSTLAVPVLHRLNQHCVDWQNANRTTCKGDLPAGWEFKMTSGKSRYPGGIMELGVELLDTDVDPAPNVIQTGVILYENTNNPHYRLIDGYLFVR